MIEHKTNGFHESFETKESCRLRHNQKKTIFLILFDTFDLLNQIFNSSKKFITLVQTGHIAEKPQRIMNLNIDRVTDTVGFFGIFGLSWTFFWLRRKSKSFNSKTFLQAKFSIKIMNLTREFQQIFLVKREMEFEDIEELEFEEKLM